jgi:hypothetical protein
MKVGPIKTKYTNTQENKNHIHTNKKIKIKNKLTQTA